MTRPISESARRASSRIHEHFARQLGLLQSAGKSRLAVPPDADTVVALMNAAFWASLRREEGYVPKISVAFVAPDEAFQPLRLERPLPLSPASLSRIAPGVERPGVHLGVWPVNGDLAAWGVLDHLPEACFVLEVLNPGLLVVKQGRVGESGKFVNVAVLEGEEIKIIDQDAATVPDCPDLLLSLLGLESRFTSETSVLIQMAVSMRAHGRGGSLLVVPENSEQWQESILHPIPYGAQPPFPSLAKFKRKDPTDSHPAAWHRVDVFAGLTAVDGATIITAGYDLLAFGAKIVRRSGFPHIREVIVTEPIEGAKVVVVEPAELGGTRHLSAAQFAHDQRDAIGMVASQDGRFTVFAWSPCEQMVHAHRIESLLL